jgi:hydroxymethylglutaryl-CoA reductase (NADPH)
MHLAQKVNQKPKGFIVLDLEWDSDASEDLPAQLIIKSKATGMEVIKGLHLMASAIDPNLAQRISEHKNYLEYRQCHLKELAAYRWLDKAGFRAMPEFMGSYKDKEREVYIVLMEFLHSNELQLFNSEEAPESWTDELIFKALDTIHKVHKMDTKPLIADPDFPIREFKAHKAISLYRKMAEILISEYKSSELEESAHQAAAYVEDLMETGKDIDFKKTWVHNDFNPRNIAVRKDGKICIYDWELAVLDYPQRDLVEFLSFTLPLDFEISRLDKHLQFHYALWAELYDFRQWKAACLYSLKVYLASRVLFYMNGRIILDFNFAERIFKNTLRMIQYLEKLSAW